MKRSEMIDFIDWFLNDQLDADCNGDITRESAEDLLEHLEHKGMLPPSRKLDYHQAAEIRNTIKEPFYEYHKWDWEYKNDKAKKDASERIEGLGSSEAKEED
jgi:hypothetical protein